jgi:plastocyanin
VTTILRTLVLSTALLFGACAAPVAGTPAASAARAAVAVAQFRFEPAALTVPAGTTVRWTSTDAILHTVTSGTSIRTDDLGHYDVRPDGRFDGTLQDAGAAFSFTFAMPGEYAYFCSRHNNMTGRVVVR